VIKLCDVIEESSLKLYPLLELDLSSKAETLSQDESSKFYFKNIFLNGYL